MTDTYKRYEMKYLLNAYQRRELTRAISTHMHPDAFGESTICNIYFDTPERLLIRRSLERPVYKEKLRLRSYGTPCAQSQVYVELKKKYKGIVYKRRAAMSFSEAWQYLHGKRPPKPCQITDEIDYFMSVHPGIAPAMYLSYDRKAFFGNDDPCLRVTLDRNILYRTSALSLAGGSYGTPLLAPDMSLMEIKVSSAMPLWLAHTLDSLMIRKTRFSKYGAAYTSELCAERMARYA